MLKNKQRGFTLIELLIAIAIIGILTTLAISNLTKAQERARDARRKSDLRVIAQGLEMFYTQNNAYPPATTISGEPTALLLTSDSYIDGGQTYIKSIPKDPRNSGNFQYYYCVQAQSATNTRRTKFNLYAQLENSNDADRFCGKSGWSATTCELSTSPTPSCGVGSNSGTSTFANLTDATTPLANYVVTSP